MSQLPILVPASRLSMDPKNIRRKRSTAFQAQMKASVAEKGILQNLVGRPVPRKKGWFYVSAGGSRLEAVQANIADGVFDADYPVPVLVRDGKDASESSLIENVLRADLTPTEECRGYQDVFRIDGVSIADLAKRMHRSQRYIRGRLRLADLHEAIFDALDTGDISLEVAEAYALSTGDTARQAAVFDLLSQRSCRDNVNEIRRLIASYSYKATDPRCLLVGRDAYLAAGGNLDADLLTELEDERWPDTHIVDRLVDEALQKAASEIQARDGYAEVRPVPALVVPYMETYDLEPLSGEQVPTTPEQENRLEVITAEIEAIEAGSENPDDDDKARLATLQAELEAIEGRPAELGEAQRANARAYLIIGPDGQPRLHHEVFAQPTLITTPASMEEGGHANVVGDAGDIVRDDVSTTDEAFEQPMMSQVLIDRLATMKTELLAVHVASNPAFALDLGTFIMVDRAIRPGDGSDIPSELRADAAPVRARDFDSGSAAAAEWEKFDAALDRSWAKHERVEDRYDAFCTLPDGLRAAWLGWCVARTLHAVPHAQPGAALIDRVGQKLDIDVAAWWRPTAINFFDKLTVRAMLSILEDLGGSEFRARYGASKKHDLAASAERIFAGDTIVEADVKARALAWVPDAMRFGAPR
ncbi:ParB/RepB/Spo0J family partition protein [Sphingomonas sp. 1185]|uniref:ParB/RepB/Spo0J family partition protein n=1 Tax=Sphingomonas sp. 1185 TaxID=3156411 RepID=UPI003390D0F1